MRKAITALIGATTLALPIVEAAAAAQSTAKKKTVTKKVTGQEAEANRWGTVQVNVTERLTSVGGKKVTVKFVDLGGRYSYHTDRSQFIMSQALPMLRQEFLAAQSANVQMISGATDTSNAFIQSLQSALLKAHS